MYLKKLLSAFLLFALVFVVQTASAQEKTVTGKVFDSKDGSPVVGASVQPKGSKSGTTTNAEGTFSIKVGAGVNSIIITSIGYDRQEVSILKRVSFSVAREEITGTAGHCFAEIQNCDFHKRVFLAWA